MMLRSTLKWECSTGNEYEYVSNYCTCLHVIIVHVHM